MRKLLLGEADLTEWAGDPLTCRYQLLVRTTPPPVCCESYGISVEIVQTGEREEVWDLTVRPDRIQELAEQLIGGGVTPCALRDIVENWL